MRRFTRSVFLLALATLLPVMASASTVGAVSGSEWRAGRIIDDVVFTNANDMSVADIQAFLNTHVGTGGYASIPGQCDTQGSLSATPFSNASRAEYARSLGREDKFTCLNIYYEVPKTAPGPNEPASNYGGAPIPAGAQSAAQIISNAAIKYNISPKALLVKLATESPGPLTSDDWPFRKQYLYAMGAHCPDSGPGGSANCDVNYSGFSLQMDEAASLLRWYLDSMTQSWWQYKKPYQINSILWNVAETGCGASDVYIESKATAALYTYTPYQPNQAALNNMYGTGDGCSAYGNRNFWRVWYDWFGSPLAPKYSWSLVSQEAFSDAGRTKTLNTNTVAPGTTYFFTIKVKNTGNRTWTKGVAPAINLATKYPSKFCDTTWLNCERPATIKESAVAPGDIATFEFTMKSPLDYGSYAQYFSLVAEGLEWMNDIGMHWAFGVKPPTHEWQLSSQILYADTLRTRPVNMNVTAPNTEYFVTLTAKNTGNTVWKNSSPNPVNLGTSYPIDRNSAFCDASWLSCNRAATLKEAVVNPGEVGTFEFSIRTPSTTGTYNEYFRPVAEGKDWMNDIGMHLPLGVKPATYLWEWSGQTIYTDSVKTTSIASSNIANNQRVFVVLKAKNTGNTVWKNSSPNPVNLGTSYPIDRNSAFCDASWLSCNRAATLKEAVVNPGEVGTFEFYVTAPYANDGTLFNEYFRPVAEGKDWMNDIGMYLPFQMQSPDYEWGFLEQGVYTDSSRTTTANTSSLAKNTTYYMRLKAKNLGGKEWVRGNANLATSSPADRLSAFCDASWLSCNRAATLKEAVVNPGEVGTFEFSIRTPSTTGTYNEYFRPVAEGKDWMNDIGQYWSLTIQ